MSKVFTGMLLLFLNFNIDLDLGRLSLIPDFIGYMVILLGMRELAEQSEVFRKNQLAVITACLLSVISFGMEFTGTAGPGSTGLGILLQIMYYWVSYQVVAGIQDIEKMSGMQLEAAVLKQRWKQMFLASAGAYVVTLLALTAETGTLLSFAYVLLILSIVLHIRFLLMLNQVKKVYDKL